MYSSTMVDRSFVGWVELDVRQAVKLWEKPSKNLGLAIDVHDQDGNILKASQFFFQHSCEACECAIECFLTLLTNKRKKIVHLIVLASSGIQAIYENTSWSIKSIALEMIYFLARRHNCAKYSFSHVSTTPHKTLVTIPGQITHK